MPNAGTHIHAALLVGAVTIPACYYTGLSIQESAIIGASVVINEVFASPDMDLNSGSKSYKKWGILRYLWKPYQLLIGHRSWLSHSGPISYTLRFLYLFIPFFAVMSFLQLKLDNAVPYMVLFYIGGCISDTLHTLLDKTRLK